MTRHVFIERGGEAVVGGKTTYPNYMSVRVDRWRALDIIRTLASQLQDAEASDCDFMLFGELIRREEP